MAQVRSTKIVLMMEWIRISRLSIKNSLCPPAGSDSPSAFGIFASGCEPVWGTPTMAPTIRIQHREYTETKNFLSLQLTLAKPHAIFAISRGLNSALLVAIAFSTSRIRLWYTGSCATLLNDGRPCACNRLISRDRNNYPPDTNQSNRWTASRIRVAIKANQRSENYRFGLDMRFGVPRHQPARRTKFCLKAKARI